VPVKFLAILVSFSLFSFAKDYSMYAGGPLGARIAAGTMDAAGNTYLTGTTPNLAGMVSNPATTPPVHAVVTKLDPSGNVVLTTGVAVDGAAIAGKGIAVDPSGNIWMAGTADSPLVPLVNPLQSVPGAGITGYLVRFNPAGAITFSTFLGGTGGTSSANAVAADASGNVYVTGETTSTHFAPDANPQSAPSTSAMYVAKISAAGKIVYVRSVAGHSRACGSGSSCFLSARMTSGDAIAVDAAGNAYVTGNSNTTDLPVTAGALLANGVGAFVAKIDASSEAKISYLTYIGSGNLIVGTFGSAENRLSAIQLGPAGSVYLAGTTSDPNFPATSGAYQTVLASSDSASPLLTTTDAFAAKLNASGSAMEWATYLGGSQSESAYSLAVDPSGDLWVAGATTSPQFPPSTSGSGPGDFLLKLNASGSALAYAARFPSGTVDEAIAVDSAGVVRAAGPTGLVSSITPAVPLSPRIFAVANAAGGPLGGVIAAQEIVSIYGLGIGPVTPVIAAPDSSGLYPTSLGGVHATLGGLAMPLLYVSATQINAVAPRESLGIQPALQISGNGMDVPVFLGAAVNLAPQVFQNGDGSVAAVNQDGTINSSSNPAAAGSYVSIWATGTGAVGSGADGQVATAAETTCNCTIAATGQTLTPSYAGHSPGLVIGATQINFQLPAAVSGSVFSFALVVGNYQSEPVFVYVK
jgi:uncharacterized protein (TIGR03437 family)